MNKTKIKVYLLYVFAFVGILVSAYLWYEYSQPEEITCTLTGCQTVRESDYSNLLGISLPIWGVLYYLAVILFTFRLLFPQPVTKWEKAGFLAVVTGGFVFSVYLTLVEIFVIHALCQWCVVSAVAATGIYFVGYWLFNPLSVWQEIRNRPE